MVGAGVAMRAAHSYSVLPPSSPLSDQSTMTRRHAEGSLNEILPPLHGGCMFIFFFFLTGSSQASCFPCIACRRLGGLSTMSSSLDDELLSDGGPAVG